MFVSEPAGLNGLLVITVTGRVDASTDDTLSNHVKSFEKKLSGSKLLIDLSGVPHIDTKGVGQLIICHKFLSGIGCMVCWVVLNQQNQVHNVLDRTGLSEILTICDDLNDGFRKLLEAKS